jgi:hypothetical protein
MSEQHNYAVYFHPQALDVLGEAIKPYLSTGPAGLHVLCKEIDTAGAFCEMTLSRTNVDEKAVEVELMVPTSMVRMVASVSSSEVGFGFGS